MHETFHQISSMLSLARERIFQFYKSKTKGITYKWYKLLHMLIRNESFSPSGQCKVMLKLAVSINGVTLDCMFVLSFLMWKLVLLRVFDLYNINPSAEHVLCVCDITEVCSFIVVTYALCSICYYFGVFISYWDNFVWCFVVWWPIYYLCFWFLDDMFCFWMNESSHKWSIFSTCWFGLYIQIQFQIGYRDTVLSVLDHLAVILG